MPDEQEEPDATGEPRKIETFGGENCLREADLEALVGDVQLAVEVKPCSGTDLTRDEWEASIGRLGLRRADIGIDGALFGLAKEARRMARALHELPVELRERELAWLLKIALEDRRGRLELALSRSARFVDYEDAG